MSRFVLLSVFRAFVLHFKGFHLFSIYDLASPQIEVPKAFTEKSTIRRHLFLNCDNLLYISNVCFALQYTFKVNL